MAAFNMSSPLAALELNFIAESLGPFEWRKLGLYLGIPEHRLSNWERQYLMNSEQAASQMLFTWHNNQDPAMERGALIEALESCRLRMLSEKIRTGECRKGMPVGSRPVPSTDNYPPAQAQMQQNTAGAHHTNPLLPKHEVTEVKLRDLSQKLGSEWKMLGTYLGFENAEIEQLQEQHKVVKECIFQMLLEWRKKNGIKATKFKLKKALGRAERADLDDIVDESDDE